LRPSWGGFFEQPLAFSKRQLLENLYRLQLIASHSPEVYLGHGQLEAALSSPSCRWTLPHTMHQKAKRAIRSTRPTRVRLQYTLQHHEWDRVRTRLAEFPASFYPQQTAELVTRCYQSARLRRVMPYVSLGRLGFGLPGSLPSGPVIADDSPCAYFTQGRYIVSSYDNVTQWPFATAAAAIAFVEQHLTAVPRE
jgi:hypothetical protein